MPDSRKVPFANGEIYHIFNRGIDRRPTFTSKKEYFYMLDALRYYQFNFIKSRLSNFRALQPVIQKETLEKYYSSIDRKVEILTFALMPNHFHLLIKQITNNGISSFMAAIANSYTKYFNPRHNRLGPLFQGLFKSVHIETDEQLIHVDRYILLNPVVASIVEIDKLSLFPFTSYLEYINPSLFPITNSQLILEQFKSRQRYIEFINDHVDYAKKLNVIKHLTLD